MDENEALERFAGGDEETARRAFDCLAATARPYLTAILRRTTGLQAEQREDIVQATLVQAWGARSTYRAAGVEAWHGYLKTTARHCCVDLYRRHTETSRDGTLLEETEASEYTDAVGTVMDAIEADTLRRYADHLWLGLDPTLPADAHTRRLLAAQLTYLDRLPWRTVLRLLGPGRPGEPPLTRETLDAWLADAGVLRHLAYQTLYYGNDRLAGYLLGLTDPPAAAELDALTQTVSKPPRTRGPGGWTWPETAVILWRYRYALLFEQILLRTDCPLNSDALTALIDRTLSCFPFSEEAATLLAALGPLGRKALTDRGLWQRLAFQYRYGDDLPHNDIRDRTQPAYRHVAEPDRPAITAGMLNVWLSNGRLLERLARVCRGLEGGEDDE